MLRSLLLAACALAFTTASAQIDIGAARAFVPTHIGDSWAYEYHKLDCPHVTSGGGCTTTNRVYTYRIVGEEIRGTDTLAVVEGPGTRALFGPRADGSGWIIETVETAPGAGPLFPPLPYPTLFRQMVGGQHAWSFQVGGLPYTGIAITASGGVESYALVRDVGVISYYYSYQGSGGVRRETSWRLTSADVGGHHFGPGTADEESPALAARLAVGPNPTTGMLTARMTLDAPAALRLDATDVLGRVVWSSDARASVGDFETRIDLTGVPPGTYVVRLFRDGALADRAVVTRAGTR